MEAYKTKKKVVNRTLTVELPEDFQNAEVEVIVLQDKTSRGPDPNESDKWKALRAAKGIVSDASVEIDEEEWYKQ